MTATTSSIPVDLYRDGDTYVVNADLPGVDPSSVDVDIDGALLTIRAERTATVSDSAKWLARGRQTGSFVRRFTLGQAIDRDSIAAKYDNGVLSISIPVSEKAKARKIEVVSTNAVANDAKVTQDDAPVAA